MNLGFILNIIILFFSFFIAVTTLKHSILFDHDLIYPFFRDFLHPEHGRYIATYISSLLIERIPVFLNIHPNDFIQMVGVPIKSFFIVLFVFLISNSISFFQHTKFKLFDFNIPFYPLYILLFMFFFSEHFFLDYDYLQFVVFWEYPMSLLPFFILILYAMFCYVNEQKPNNKLYSFSLIILFLVGISIEPINLCVLFEFTIITILVTIKNKFSFSLNKKIYYSYILYLFAILIYYSRGNDSSFIFGDYTLIEYIKNELPIFISSSYKEFLFVHSKVLVPIAIFLVLIYFINRTDKSVRFLKFTLLGIFTMMAFHFGTFLWGYNDYDSLIRNLPSDQIFYCNYPKFIKLYAATLIFYLVLSISFFINISLSLTQKQKNILNYIIPIILSIFVYNSFIKNYKNELSNFISQTYNKKLLAYIAEKEIVQSKDETVTLSSEILEKIIQFHNPDWFLKSKKIIYYPTLTKVKCISYADNKDINYSIITDEEKRNIKFSNLLIERRKKLVKSDDVLHHICSYKENCPYY